MRAILVKVGALLASDHFQVAIGDRPVEPSEQQPPQTEVDTAGEMESCEGDTGEGVSGAHSESDDSEHPSALEVKEKRGESEMEEKKDGEKLYELLKQQIEAHREQVGDSEDTDRSALSLYLSHTHTLAGLIYHENMHVHFHQVQALG